MSGRICPSMMCADIYRLPEYLEVFQREGIAYLHMDVMDGVFVPNFQLGTDFIRQLRAKSAIPLDIHLMIEHPESKLDWFGIQPGEYVSIHVESTPHVHRAIAKIRDLGGKPMLAINPATPISALEDMIGDIDGVLVMTVDPGFAGQKMIPQMLDKIARLRRWLSEIGRPEVEIEVDGNVSFPNARKMADAGADLFVAGTASIFNAELPLLEAIRHLQKSVA